MLNIFIVNLNIQIYNIEKCLIKYLILQNLYIFFYHKYYLL